MHHSHLEMRSCVVWAGLSDHLMNLHRPLTQGQNSVENSNSPLHLHNIFPNLPKNMELTVRSLLSASLCQSVVNSTSACRPSVTTSIRRVVISKFCSWSCKSHRHRYFSTTTKSWNKINEIKCKICSFFQPCVQWGHMHSNVCRVFVQSWEIGTSENNLDIIYFL